MDIGRKIELMLAFRGVSQPKLAAKLEMSQATVSNWVTGKSLPRLPELEAIARELRTTADYLVRRDDERTPEQLEHELKVREIAAWIGWEEAWKRLVGRTNATAEPRIVPPHGHPKDKSG
jgi:transcriptional regulator with XRE-family HTH domain